MNTHLQGKVWIHHWMNSVVHECIPGVKNCNSYQICVGNFYATSLQLLSLPSGNWFKISNHQPGTAWIKEFFIIMKMSNTHKSCGRFVNICFEKTHAFSVIAWWYHWRNTKGLFLRTVKNRVTQLNSVILLLLLSLLKNSKTQFTNKHRVS